jgi:hypothetical protein
MVEAVFDTGPLAGVVRSFIEITFDGGEVSP